MDKVFLATPGNPDQVSLARNGIAAAKRAGGPHIVRLSAGAVKDMPGAFPRLAAQHAEIDAALKASGLTYTLLQPQNFMQNTLMVAQTVASEGVIYMAAEDGKLGMIDARDISEVAAKVLTEDGHESKAYRMTGPASISFHDVAAGLSKALGKEVKYVNVPLEAAREGMVSMGIPEWLADAANEYNTAFSEGFSDFTTNDFEEITGHPARSYETFARDFAPVFGGVSQS